MSDVLIKNMEMPKSCYTCQFCDNYEGSFCLATNDAHHIDYMTAIRRRPKWCPLVEVKPHGRLIDADKLKEALLSDEDYRVFVIEDIDEVIKKYIDTAPTILEASDVF